MSEPVPPRDLIGNEEVRELCGGISRNTLIAWRDNDFPKPIRTIGQTDIWDRREVRAWLKANREFVKRARKWSRDRRP